MVIAPPSRYYFLGCPEMVGSIPWDLGTWNHFLFSLFFVGCDQ
jgi:hypothetical protein